VPIRRTARPVRSRHEGFAGADHLLEVLLNLDLFVGNTLDLVALAKVLNKCDPPEGRKL